MSCSRCFNESFVSIVVVIIALYRFFLFFYRCRCNSVVRTLEYAPARGLFNVGGSISRMMTHSSNLVALDDVDCINFSNIDFYFNNACDRKLVSLFLCFFFVFLIFFSHVRSSLRSSLLAAVSRVANSFLVTSPR